VRITLENISGKNLCGENRGALLRFRKGDIGDFDSSKISFSYQGY
jgi:hypothetical protein